MHTYIPMYTHAYTRQYPMIIIQLGRGGEKKWRKEGGGGGGCDSHSLHRVTNSPVNTQWAQLGLRDIKEVAVMRGGGEIVATRRHRSAVFASDWPLPILGKTAALCKFQGYNKATFCTPFNQIAYNKF